MKIVRIVLLASAVGLGGVPGGVPPAVSQGANTAAPIAEPSAEAVATAKELMALIASDIVGDLTSKVIAQTWPAVEQSVRRQYPQIDAATSAELHTEFEKQISANVAESLNDAPSIYARYLTVQEMHDIEAFYRTPTGAKALKLMPQITGEMMGQFAPRMQGMMDRVNAAITAVLQKHGLLKQ